VPATEGNNGQHEEGPIGAPALDPGAPAHVDPPLTGPVIKPDAFVRFLVAHPRAVRAVIWAIVLGAISSGLYLWVAGHLDVESTGYTGAFVVNLVGSGAIVVPVPGLAAVCGASSSGLGLNPFLLGLLGGLGATIGEITGYLAGFGSQTLLSRYRLYARIHHWVQTRGGLALFILAVIPNPVFDIAGVAAGGLGYPLQKFLLYVGTGKIIRFIGFSYACRFGIDWITRIAQ
jgi:membrane protein DedA with SNARE-associated domain